MNQTKLTRVEKHVIKPSNVFYNMLLDFCHKAKNLYNHANYVIRHEFISNNRWIRYYELDKLLKSDNTYPDYANMPTAQCAQQTLKLLDKNWKSYFKSIKDWKKQSNKYLGKPKLPKYKNKNGYSILILTNQTCKLKADGIIYFPKVFNGFIVKPKFVNKESFSSFQQIRLIPQKGQIIIEIVYNIRDVELKPDNNRYIGIDIGVNNLAAVCNNISKPCFVINGKPLKSINRYYNKQNAHYKSIAKKVNNKDYSHRMRRLANKRMTKIDDYMHKASRYVVNYCIANDINTIVIGKNNNWKQKSDMSKVNNQSFVQLPFTRFIQMIQYKASELGITVKLTEESYTSGTSFIDNENPVKDNYNKARRVSRGMFVSNNGMQVNADINGAYQILRKVVPIKWDSGCVLQPFVVTMV